MRSRSCLRRWRRGCRWWSQTRPWRPIPRGLARLIVAAGVTRLLAVPSLLAVLVEEAGSELAASRLVQVTSSGEPLSGQLARQLRGVLPAGCRIVNLYGSTEVAADATCYELEHDPGERVPIGRPIDNVHVRILGPDRELLPPGAIGQLYVGGAGLSPGYTGHAATNQQDRFIDDPLQPGHSLYQTGDLARWRSDGQLDYLGRSDRQLKIRGVRVEPAEIEHVLSHHPHIREAAVITRPTPNGPELAAYLTTTTPTPAPDALRAYLKNRLPDQLIPTHLTILDHLPHLPNGKLDHTTLTNHTPTPTGRRTVATAPRSAAEQIVADTFADVLGVERRGGLRRLLLARRPLAARDPARLGARSQVRRRAAARRPSSSTRWSPISPPRSSELLLAEIRARTGATMAEARTAGEQRALQPAERLPTGRPAGRTGSLAAEPGQPAPLSFAQRRLWFFDRLMPGQPAVQHLVRRADCASGSTCGSSSARCEASSAATRCCGRSSQSRGGAGAGRAQRRSTCRSRPLDLRQLPRRAA